MKLPRSWAPLLLVVLILVAGLGVSGCLADVHANEGYTTATVTGKHIDFSDGDSYYVISTSAGPFEINRPILDTFNQTRNPDTTYDMIQVGHTYRFHTYGVQADWLYQYPIIVAAQEVNSSANTTTTMVHTTMSATTQAIAIIILVIVAGLILYFVLGGRR